MTLDIIVPVYNKEKNILNCYNKLQDELSNIKHTFIFIDDGSEDKTLELLKNIQESDEEHVRIISLSKHFEKDIAIKAGIDHSKSNLVCIFDMDLQANTSYIIKMYEFLLEHKEYDSVCMYSNYEEKNTFKKVKNKLLNRLYDLNIDINKTNYRMFRRNIVNAIIKSDNENLLYLFENIGFNTYYLKFDNKNHINQINMNNLKIYSNNPSKIVKLSYIVLFIIFIILIVLRLLNIIRIGNSTMFFSLFMFTIINLFTIKYLFDIKIKKQKKNIYYVREKIGFDDNLL